MKKRITFYIVIFSLFSFLCTNDSDITGTVSDVNSGSISGLLIQDSTTFKEDVNVLLYKKSSRNRATDSLISSSTTSDGSFLFDSLDAGEYSIEVIKDSIIIGTEPLISLDAGEAKNIIINITIIINQTINITNVDNSKNTVINNFIINNGTVTKDSTGDYVISVTEADTQIVQIEVLVDGVMDTVNVIMINNGDGTFTIVQTGQNDPIIVEEVDSNDDNTVARLIAYYPFNGNTNDESGEAKHCVNNEATLTSDRFENLNSAYSFDGVNNFIKAPDSLINYKTGSFSLWFKLDDISSYRPLLSLTSTTVSQGDHFQVVVYQSGTSLDGILGTRMYQGTYAISTGRVDDNNWHMYTYVSNAADNGFSIYIDGNKQSDGTFGTYNHTGELFFGKRSDDAFFFKGSLDDISFFNYCLDSNSIDSLYHIGGWKSDTLNVPPNFTSIASDLSDTLNANETYVDTVHAIDEDNDTLKFTFLDSINGMILTDSIITWTPQNIDSGIYDVSIIVSDGKGGLDTLSWNIKVNYVNSSPNFVSIATDLSDTLNAKETYVDTIHAIDKDNDTLKFTFLDSINGMILTDSIISWTPQNIDSGIHNISALVSDGKGGLDTLSWNIKVNYVNTAPNFVSIATDLSDTLNAKETYVDTVHATDDDNDALLFTFLDTINGMTLSDNIITWTPQNIDSGIHNVSVMVSDGKGGLDTLSWNIKVNYVNTAPNFISIAADLSDTLNANETYIDTVHAIDEDNNTLKFTFLDSINGMILTDSIISWTPENNDSGNHNISVMVSDGKGGLDTLSWNIKVNYVNTPPNFVSIPSDLIDSINAYETYVDTVHAIDEDNDILAFSFLQNVNGMVLTDSIITWTPENNDSGNHNISIIVSDNKGGLDTLDWNIKVKPITVETGLVAYYPFDGDVNDESGNEHHGIINGTLVPSSDRFVSDSGCYNMKNGYISFKNDEFDFVFNNGSYSISVWCNIDGDYSNFSGLLSHSEMGHDNRISFMNTHQLHVYSQINSWTVSTSEGINYNQWYMLTYSYDSADGKMRIYKNNDLIVEGNGGNFSNVNYPYEIGETTVSTTRHYINGSIDDFRIYNKALSSYEIDSLYTLNGWTGEQNTVIFSDDFESGNISKWTAWGHSSHINNQLEISTQLAHSGLYSIVPKSTNYSALQKHFDDITSGKIGIEYYLNLNVTNMDKAFNLRLGERTDDSTNFVKTLIIGLDNPFVGDSLFFMLAEPGVSSTEKQYFYFKKQTWNKIVVEYDFDSDIITVYLNNILIIQDSFIFEVINTAVFIDNTSNDGGSSQNYHLDDVKIYKN